MDVSFESARAKMFEGSSLRQTAIDGSEENRIAASGKSLENPLGIDEFGSPYAGIYLYLVPCFTTISTS